MIGEELVGDDTEAGDDTEVGDQAGDDKGDHATDSSQRVRESLDISLGVSDALPSLDEAVEDSDRGLSRLPGRVWWYAAMQPGWQDANMSRAVRVGGRRGSVQPSGKTQHVVVRRREGGGAVTMRFSLCETEERWTRRLIKAVASFRSSFVNLDPAQ